MTFKKTWADDVQEWIQKLRANTNAAKRLHRRYGHLTLAEKCLGRIFNMGKKVASATTDKNICARTLAAAVAFRDTMWWEKFRDYKLCDDAKNDAEWKHCRRGRRLRQWDQVMI